MSRQRRSDPELFPEWLHVIQREKNSRHQEDDWLGRVRTIKVDIEGVRSEQAEHLKTLTRVGDDVLRSRTDLKKRFTDLEKPALDALKRDLLASAETDRTTLKQEISALVKQETSNLMKQVSGTLLKDEIGSLMKDEMKESLKEALKGDALRSAVLASAETDRNALKQDLRALVKEDMNGVVETLKREIRKLSDGQAVRGSVQAHPHFREGVRVAHSKRGDGVVVRVEHDPADTRQEVVVRFDSGEEHGYDAHSLSELTVAPHAAAGPAATPDAPGSSGKYDTLTPRSGARRPPADLPPISR